MMTLKAEKRDSKENLDGLRAVGKVPAVFYGPKEESTPITLDASTFLKTYREAGESTIIQLEGIGEEKDVLIKTIDQHPVTGDIRHADLYVIERGKTLTVSVPLMFVGASPAEDDLGGVLTKVMHEIEVEALPRNLPHEIEADLSIIVDFATHLHVKDLVMPEGVTALADPDEAVALVSEAKEEEVEEVAEVDMDAIEVEQKGKGDEGGDDSSEGENDSA